MTVPRAFVPLVSTLRPIARRCLRQSGPISPRAPYFEIAIVHVDEDTLAELPVLDPAATVRADVERVLADPSISPRITVSGHVYDVDTGRIETVVETTSPRAAVA